MTLSIFFLSLEVLDVSVFFGLIECRLMRSRVLDAGWVGWRVEGIGQAFV